MRLRFVERFRPVHQDADYGHMERVLQQQEYEPAEYRDEKGNLLPGCRIVWRDVPIEKE